jgi:hypothetical protein
MSDAMSSAAAKSPKPLRMNQKAVLILAAQYQIWYDQAVLTSGLSELDRAVLDAVAAYYRLLEQRGHASVPTIEQMAKSAQVRRIDITSAIRNLVGLALLAVKPGAGARRTRKAMFDARRWS